MSVSVCVSGREASSMRCLSSRSIKCERTFESCGIIQNNYLKPLHFPT